MTARIDTESATQGSTQVDISVLEKDFNVNKAKVAQLLLDNVADVNIEIPKVIKGHIWLIITLF